VLKKRGQDRRKGGDGNQKKTGSAEKNSGGGGDEGQKNTVLWRGYQKKENPGKNPKITHLEKEGKVLGVGGGTVFVRNSQGR